MSDEINLTLQLVAVAFVIVVCIVYVVRRIVGRRRRPTDAECTDCPLAENCGKKSTCRRKPGGGCGCGCS